MLQMAWNPKWVSECSEMLSTRCALHICEVHEEIFPFVGYREIDKFVVLNWKEYIFYRSTNLLPM